MSNDSAFTMDFSQFNEAFLKHTLETCPKAAERGMFEALSELKNDADSVTPKTPHLEGNLRGDYTFILEGITQSKVTEVGSQHKGNVAPVERFNAKNIIAKIVFRMPYAAKWHEAVDKKVNWSEPGVGPKYLETKLMMFNKKYMSIVAWAIAAANSGTPDTSDIQWNPTGDEGMGDDNPRF